jgi:hypothetical protein
VHKSLGEFALMKEGRQRNWVFGCGRRVQHKHLEEKIESEWLILLHNLAPSRDLHRGHEGWIAIAPMLLTTNAACDITRWAVRRPADAKSI